MADSDPQYVPKTPLMQQYFRARAEHPGVVLLMRVGDFYEAYGEDAETIASALNITLTGREDGGVRVAMAGVPHHATERYVARLIRKGHRVALMDQVEDPKLAKGLVKRKVTRVVSKGTVFEDSLLDAKTNNFLVAAVELGETAGIAITDVSTGEFLVTEMTGSDRLRSLVDEICRLEPAELIVPGHNEELADLLEKTTGVAVHAFVPADLPTSGSPQEALTSHFGTSSLRGFGCEDYTAGLAAAALVLGYLKETQTGAAKHITSIGAYSTRDFMTLDAAARRNLELTASLSGGGRGHTLLGVLDETVTPMGGRLLRRWLEEPLLDPVQIEARLEAVAGFGQSELVRGDVRELMKGIHDIERFVSRAATGLANARDLVALRDSLERLPELASTLDAVPSQIVRDHARLLAGSPLVQLDLLDVREIAGVREPSSIDSSSIDLSRGELSEAGSGTHYPPAVPPSPTEIAALIRRAICDEPPAVVRDGGIIREGYSEELDTLRSVARDGRSWIATLEADERVRTGIGSLKVGYNAVFGYYIEVTKANLTKVPEEYIRKQTTASGERYITPALKEYEEKVLRADDHSVEIEQRLFAEVRECVASASAPLLDVARAIAAVDTLSGFAEVAVRYRFVRPQITDGETIRIRAGRHPVVERIQGMNAFVPNDCLLDCNDERLHIITGPNMSGKSTALRQVALITLLAQVGSFVPADHAEIGVVDRIFTRVGAHDELATGQSTFMVEMNETANILNNATRRSLVVLDEIGRGTSTYDGLSIAWAVAERLVETGCKTLFATHYHYLNDLAQQLGGVRNFRVAVKERGDQIVWLRKLVPGGTDRSYGIQVARMAGVPVEVIDRAREILKSLERGGAREVRGVRGVRGGRDQASDMERVPSRTERVQLKLFEAEKHPVLEVLEALDVTELTPVEALMKLDELVRLAHTQTV